MKKLLLLFVATASLLISCDKNDDNNTIDNSTLLHGKWEVKSFTAEATMNGTPIPLEDVEFSGTIGTVFEFYSNNKMKVTSYDDFDETWYTEEGTYVYNVAQGEIITTMVDSEDNSTYVQKMKVNALTNSNFNFSAEESETYEGMVIKLTMDFNCVRKN